MQDFYQKYIKNNQDLFSFNPKDMASANKKLAPIFQNALMASTVSEVPRGDIAFARQLAGKADTSSYISPEQYNTFIKLAKQNLNIPAKQMSKMNVQQLLSELLGLAEKPR